MIDLVTLMIIIVQVQKIIVAWLTVCTYIQIDSSLQLIILINLVPIWPVDHNQQQELLQKLYLGSCVQ